ncbi:NUDIX hydrolase [Streptomyces carminius]|uniref:NUDIX hydrolase n=1 Tax=Streptomyces carminius TaxID=2665496 RepID=A0A2M8LQH8_9ACTN|nr:NUDIX hydrolase [Streptomyces carminius]PJE94186.1 NUDIX hydrolase [Streptomyces carminius]
MPPPQEDSSLAAYELLRRDRPELFHNDGEGGIDVIDPAEAAEDAGRIGIVYSDEYIRLLRDPVRFPDGRVGTYLRIISASEGPAGAVLPLVDGRVVLLENYRHATRSWHLEIPRGFGTEGLTAEENALKELREEVGVRAVSSITPLGTVHPDTGLHGQSVHLFLAVLDALGAVETGAGIRGTVLLTPQEVDDRVLSGTITDGFTLAAFTQARLRRLL